ncbi:MAG: heparan-alpha-glucosaminide N-acetyltransferase domain-containing protein, partial [Nostocoides sp.]
MPDPSSQLACARGRVNALDVARGVMLLLSVSAEAVLSPRPNAFVHTQWTGLHYYDWIFPLFVTLSGCGMAFAFRSGVRWRRNARRVLVLVAAGLAYNYVVAPERGLADLRFTGVLQLYAGLVLAVALLHRFLRTAGQWAAFTLLWSAVLTLAWFLISRQCPGGIPQPTCNPTLSIDGVLGSNHLYKLGERGFEPEGLLGLMGALSTTAAGVTAGHLISKPTRGGRAGTQIVAWAAITLAAGGLLWLLVPGLKWLWTPSYGLVTGAAGLVLMGICYWLVDSGPVREVGLRFTRPLVALGRNSLLVYFGSHVAMMLMLRVGEPALPYRVAQHLSWTGHAGLAWVLLSVLAWWVVALVL